LIIVAVDGGGDVFGIVHNPRMVITEESAGIGEFNLLVVEVLTDGWLGFDAGWFSLNSHRSMRMLSMIREEQMQS